MSDHTTGDPTRYDLDRFLRAQDGVLDDALAELRRGRKTSHWMWFVFPQLAGLGRSATAEHFGVRGLAEARAYLAHPVLGERLRTAATVVTDAPAPSAAALLGGTDALKLRSSMTLFGRAATGAEPFAAVLDRWFDGEEDPVTVGLLDADDRPPGNTR